MRIPIVNNFVAGTSKAEAIERVRRLNAREITGIVNYLGEHNDDRNQSEADACEYIALVNEFAAQDVNACISVKPSQVGLDVGEDCFRDNMHRIANASRSADVFVWIDMEDSSTTDVTLDVYESLAVEHGQVGVCVQANLRRTPEDLEQLAQLPGKVRLVKGAYAEPKSVAYQDRERVDQAYRDCLQTMFREFDSGIAVASHDPEMIALATELHREFGTPFEIQMLMGVREAAQTDLVSDDVDVYQYVPYGEEWASYFYRRIRERKENALFALRAIMG